jgi:hypothetical protein
METKTVRLDGENEAVVARATMRMALKRTRVMQELTDAWIARESVRRGEPVTRATFLIDGIDDHFAFSIYVDLLCATVETRGFQWPVSYAEFSDWDGVFADSRVTPWMAAILEINPHWYADQEVEPEGEENGASGSE